MNEKAKETLSDKYDKFNCIIKVMDFIRENYSKNHSIEDYANYCNLNKYYFIKLFNEYAGETPYHFKSKLRTDKAKELLENTNMTNAQIAEKIGYSSSFYFSRIFKKHTGISPDAYRKMFKK